MAYRRSYQFVSILTVVLLELMCMVVPMRCARLAYGGECGRPDRFVICAPGIAVEVRALLLIRGRCMELQRIFDCSTKSFRLPPYCL